MATLVATSSYFTLGGVDLTDHIEEASIELEADEVDFTNLGSAGYREFKGGLKKATLKVTFQNDYASSKVEQTVINTVGIGVLTDFNLRATSASVSATNPKYTGSILCSKFEPVALKVGDKVMSQVSWPVSGAWVRGTA